MLNLRQLFFIAALAFSGQALSAYLPGGSAIISDGNSSTTPLNNGQTYTGTWTDVSSFDSVVIAVKTDQDGYFTVQFSPDGTNADSTLTKYYRTTQIEPPHRYTITRKYARVTFTNDSGSNQTYFRLQTSLGSKTPLNVPNDQVMAQDYDAAPVRPSSFDMEVALGLRQGVEAVNKFGHDEDQLIAEGMKTVWDVSSSLTLITAAQTVGVASDDVDDDGNPSCGTGACTIRLYGIDGNYNRQTEDVTLNGTATVTTSSTWLGIDRIRVLTAGSSKHNPELSRLW